VLNRWSRLLDRLGLTRAGRVAFTVTAVLGFGLAAADDLTPRSGSEADLGPNVAAVVSFFVLLVLGAVVATDAAFRVLRKGARIRQSRKSET
jgi:hypothetical protein